MPSGKLEASLNHKEWRLRVHCGVGGGAASRSMAAAHGRKPINLKHVLIASDFSSSASRLRTRRIADASQGERRENFHIAPGRKCEGGAAVMTREVEVAELGLAERRN